jgi:hypothetical protein
MRKITFSAAFISVLFLTSFFSCKTKETPTSFPFAAKVYQYDSSSSNLKLTSADLSITSDSTILVRKKVSDTISAIEVPDGFTTFQVKVTKAGYNGYEKNFTAGELKSFSTTEPLKIVLQPETLSNGLVAWYPFNGNAEDESENNFHGTVNSALLTSDKNGVENTAYLFDGDSYIQIPEAPLKLNEFTYSLWVNPTIIAPSGTSSAILSVGDQFSALQQVVSQANHYGSALFNGLFVGGWNHGPENPVVANVGTNTLPTANQWVHIVWVRHMSYTSMYLNNQLIGTVATNNYLPYYGTATIANIGMRCNFTQGFVGKIDNLRIYNRPLTAAEIGALYHE